MLKSEFQTRDGGRWCVWTTRWGRALRFGRPPPPPIPQEPKGSPRAVRHPDEGLGGGRSLGPGVPSSLSSRGDIAPPLSKAQLGKGQAWRTRTHLGLISRSPPSARLPAPLTATAFVNGMSPTSTHFETDKKVQSKSGAIPQDPRPRSPLGVGLSGEEHREVGTTADGLGDVGDVGAVAPPRDPADGPQSEKAPAGVRVHGSGDLPAWPFRFGRDLHT